MQHVGEADKHLPLFSDTTTKQRPAARLDGSLRIDRLFGEDRLRDLRRPVVTDKRRSGDSDTMDFFNRLH